MSHLAGAHAHRGVHDIVEGVRNDCQSLWAGKEQQWMSLGPSRSVVEVMSNPDIRQIGVQERAYLRGMALDDLISLSLIL